ncbi:MAG: hypothetical protein FWC20_00950 [Oscillospiraceae bacterium]|nr:hypothetical protein [Oscillospiraceae bacterium]MCL2277961.1 hypothetical protein [Oscillospiraceae bacterium]
MNNKRQRAGVRKKAEKAIRAQQIEKSQQTEQSAQVEESLQAVEHLHDEDLPQAEESQLIYEYQIAVEGWQLDELAQDEESQDEESPQDEDSQDKGAPQEEMPPETDETLQTEKSPETEQSPSVDEPKMEGFEKMPWGSVAALAVLCVASLVTGIVYWYNNYYRPSDYEEGGSTAETGTILPSGNIFGFHDVADSRFFHETDAPSIQNSESSTPELRGVIDPFPEFVELWEIYGNDDIVGILHLAGHEEMILQADSNSFYLTHDINREHSATGQAFLDYSVDLIMGLEHNMVVYIPYGVSIREALREYSSYDFFLRHPHLSFSTLFGDFEWEIFSFYVSPPTLPFLTVNHPDNYTWGEAVMHFTLASMYNTRLDVTEYDQIITIVSPTDIDSEMYYVLQARMLRQITS